MINQMVVPLSSLTVGESGIICDYQGECEVQARLKEVGLIRGAVVRVERFAPLGDPMELVIKGYHLALRKEDAAGILVQRQN